MPITASYTSKAKEEQTFKDVQSIQHTRGGTRGGLDGETASLSEASSLPVGEIFGSCRRNLAK